jgi:hypothetical protein
MKTWRGQFTSHKPECPMVDSLRLTNVNTGLSDSGRAVKHALKGIGAREVRRYSDSTPTADGKSAMRDSSVHASRKYCDQNTTDDDQKSEQNGDSKKQLPMSEHGNECSFEDQVCHHGRDDHFPASVSREPAC